MKPVIAIYDNFFKKPENVYHDVVTAGKFEDFTSPADGVVYPGINQSIPEYVSDELLVRLSDILDDSITNPIVFARATHENTPPAPHYIHSDKIMADYSCHVYLSKVWPYGSGTAIWEHKTQGNKHTDETDVDTVINDMNSSDNWFHVKQCQGKFNRILMHDASLWHSAEPYGGWGESHLNGRVVLTCFFSVGSK